MGRVKRAIFKFQPFSKKQKKILTWWLEGSGVSDADGIIADGAIRSGKTVSMALSFAFWAMENFEEQTFAMCGKTIGAFRRNVLTVLKLMLRSRGYKVKDLRADNLIIITRRGITNYFYIFGGKDERSQDLIQGITLAGIFCDEVALMPESFVNQATGRCSVDGSKMWFNCNPEGPYHWFKVKWIDKSVGYLGRERADELRREGEEIKNLLYLHFTMEDNLSLSEKIKARYRSMYAGVFFKRYILGLWYIAEGLVYGAFGDQHITKKTPESGEYYISVDYGTMNPFSAGLWCVSDGKAVRIKEYYYSGRDKQEQKTDDEYCNEIKKLAEGHVIRKVIVDPSATSFIAALRKRGYTVQKADNDVLDGIRRVSVLLQQGKILIHESCKDSIREFRSYSWDTKSSEDRVIKENDHAMDDIRYFVNTITWKKFGKKEYRSLWAMRG